MSVYDPEYSLKDMGDAWDDGWIAGHNDHIRNCATCLPNEDTRNPYRTYASDEKDEEDA